MMIFSEKPSFKSLVEGRQWRRCCRVFQTRAPATVKARSSTVECLADDTSKRLVLAKGNVCWLGRSATGTSGPKYCGTHGRRSHGGQGEGHFRHFLKKIFLHEFAADTRLYMCELLVWLRVMFQSVFQVNVLYVFKYWLTTAFAWSRFL